MRFDCETYQLTLVLQLKENQFLKQLVLAPNGTFSIIESSGAVSMRLDGFPKFTGENKAGKFFHGETVNAFFK